MKTYLILFIAGFILFSESLFANEYRVRMRPQDRLIFDVFLDIWQDTPDEIDLEIFNRGVNIALVYDYPIGYSNFSVASGISFTSHNMYSDHWYSYSSELDGYKFIKIDEQLSYSNNKISLNYIDLPVEFRFRTTPTRDFPHTFRVALGAKLGFLVQSHTKYVGDYFVENDENNNIRSIRYKEHSLDNIEDWRYGIMARIGYGNVNITAYYPLTGIFKHNNFTDMRPISIGLSFIIN